MSENATAEPSACERINLPFTHVFLPVVFVVVFVVGTFANVLGLRSVWSGWSSIGSINIFMLNLGLADLLYLSTLPFLVAYYAHGSEWRYGRTFCKVTRFCFNLNLYGSIGFLTCISVYRYLGIVHPMRVMGKITGRHSAAISVLVWLLVCAQILPDMFFDKSDPGSPNSCFDTTSDPSIGRYLSYSLGWTVTGFAVPLLVILACYGHVIVVLATKANINALLKQRCLKLVVILVLLFSICFVPYHVLRNLNLSTRILKLRGICRDGFGDIYVAHQISRGLVSLNSAINPLIYLVGNDSFLLRFHQLGRRARVSLAGWTSRPTLVATTPRAYTLLNVDLLK